VEKKERRGREKRWRAEAERRGGEKRWREEAERRGGEKRGEEEKRWREEVEVAAMAWPNQNRRKEEERK
jgi:hypothetical protein